jgi:hypothetical protein
VQPWLIWDIWKSERERTAGEVKQHSSPTSPAATKWRHLQPVVSGDHRAQTSHSTGFNSSGHRRGPCASPERHKASTLASAGCFGSTNHRTQQTDKQAATSKLAICRVDSRLRRTEQEAGADSAPVGCARLHDSWRQPPGQTASFYHTLSWAHD